MQNFLRSIIKEEVTKFLFEAEPVPSTDDSTESPPAASPSVTPGPSSLNPADSGVQSPGEGGQAPLDASGNALETPPVSGSGPITTMSGGGFGGGSGGRGAETDSAGSDPSAQIPTDSPGLDSELDSSDEDPVEEMKTKALEITEKTKDVQKALKAIKAIIQEKYKDPKEALEFVDTLVNENEQLKPLARRLAFYLLGK